jgi:integrase
MHDFRRGAAREMWRAGSTVGECMEVTGHATAAMLKRYADLFKEDERRALQRKVQERHRM